MKSISIRTALVAVLAATTITVCPMAWGAADCAPDYHREPGTVPASAVLCPLKPKAASDGCATGVSDRAANGSVAIVLTEMDDRQPSEQNDLSGALLEDLVKMDSGRPAARP